MSKKGVEDMISELEIFIDNCKFSPLSSNKIVVPKDEISSMLDELRLKLPSEIDRSKKIMRNKEAILTDARSRADAMLEEANMQAKRIVSESQIVELANIQAAEIVQMANAQAAEIINAANQEADEVRLGAMYYTQDQLEGIKKYIISTLETEKNNFTHLIESLENDAFVVTTNADEIDSQIRMMTGQVVEPVAEPQMQQSVAPQVQTPVNPTPQPSVAQPQVQAPLSQATAPIPSVRATQTYNAEPQGIMLGDQPAARTVAELDAAMQAQAVTEIEPMVQAPVQNHMPTAEQIQAQAAAEVQAAMQEQSMAQEQAMARTASAIQAQAAAEVEAAMQERQAVAEPAEKPAPRSMGTVVDGYSMGPDLY